MANTTKFLGAAAAAGAAAGLVAAGLRVEPAPLTPFPDPGPQPELRELPADLPVPVIRWLVGHYGAQLPVISSVVITGRARLRPFGVWLPARFRFTHDAGRGYRHYIEATFAGRPMLRVNESFLDGVARMSVPLSGESTGPKLAQAANMGMWAELATAAPAVLATHPRVRWSPIDEQSALFTYPSGGEDGTDELVVRFAPETGALASLEGWRYRSAGDANAILWIAAVAPGGTVAGPVVGPWGLPAVGTATWADQAEPWATFTTEEIVVNADVTRYLRERGA